MSENYQRSFDRLNPAQRQAVETIYGPVLVVAGPGTGKTQLLTTRIAHILKTTDVGPGGILCLTFTESGATEMRRRLQQWIGAEAYRVRIQTFHGFCDSVLQEYPQFFPTEVGEFSLADDLERALIYRAIIDAKTWQYLKPFNDKYYYQRAFLSAVSQLKRENFTPDSLRMAIPAEKERRLQDPDNFYKRDSKYGKKGDLKAGIADKIDKVIGKMTELADLWEAFETAKRQQKKYDFDDQIYWVLQSIKNHPELKSELQERFQFILVDEYQDTNNSQNQILWELSDYFDDPNLFAVGDDDQAIYRFQGASLKNILDFETRFPKTQRVTLSENYRSAQSILDASYHSVGKNLERLDNSKSLQASGDNKAVTGQIHQAEFLSRSSELIWLSQQIKTCLKNGTKPQDIAILVRENREAREITRYLEQFGVRVSNRALDNLFEDPLVLNFVELLHVWLEPGLDHAFYQVLHAPHWKLDPEVLLDIHLQARNRKSSIAEQLKDNSDPALQKIWKLISTSRKDYAGAAPLVVAEKLFHHTGLANWINRPGNSEQMSQLQKFKKLFAWLDHHQNFSLPEVLDRITLHQELEVPVFPDPLPSDLQAVQVMTTHRAKGLEFEIVFIPGLLDRVWGNKRRRQLIPLPQITEQSHDPNEDERRLFFVALTRAKQQIFCSYAQQDLSGRERLPAEFWHEVPESLVTTIDTDQAEAEAQALLPVFFQTPDTPVFTGNEQTILRKLVANFVWSASSLQNYLDCPRKFLYLNLLKVPTPSKSIFGYGSAMHEALEKFLQQYRMTGKGEVARLLEHFDQALKSQNLTTLERQEALAHGQEILANYHSQVLQAQLEGSQHWLFEADFRTELQDIPVYGRVDKVELSEDKAAGLLVDYKSGKPKKIVPGERLWRQLVFYDLLVNNTPKLSWKATGLELEWLTPDLKGRFVRTPLQITDEDRAQVIEELKRAHEKLQQLEFPMIENPNQDPEIDYWQSFGRNI